MAAAEAKSRRRRAAGRAPANGTIEISEKDLQQLLDALRSARDGETGVRLPAQKRGLMGDVARAYNQLAQEREALCNELGRVSKVIRREGRIAMQGYYPEPIAIDFHPTHMQRPTVIFPCGWDDEFNEDLADDMAAGRIAIDPLITHRIPYQDAEPAYRLVLDHPDQTLGMVFQWSEA